MYRLIVAFGLMYSSGCYADEFPLQCFYAPDEPQGELQPFSNCAARDGQIVRFAPEHLQRMSFGPLGLAQVAVDKQHYYVAPDGQALAVITYDNGPDPFADGLVRSLVDGKIAYFDSTLRQVIPPKYDWGFPFESGKAVVCLGCGIAPPDDQGYKQVVGGLWGCIDMDGREVVPIVHGRNEMPPCAS